MAMKLKVGENVTRDQLKLADNVPYFLEFQSIPLQQPDTRKLDANGSPVGKAPPVLANVAQYVEDDAGGILVKEYVFILNTVLANIIAAEFPGEIIIGQKLQITRLSKREGKNYSDFRVASFEIEETK